MKDTGKFAMLALLLGVLPGSAFATDPRPLQLDLPAAATRAGATRPAPFERNMAPRASRVSTLFQRDNRDIRDFRDNANPNPRPPAARTDLQNRARDLGRQALSNVLDLDAMPLDEQRSEGRMQLKFQKRGGGLRDLNKSYRDICDRVSQKIWDDPNGKRIRFDVAGKPGVGFEIPIGHH